MEANLLTAEPTALALGELEQGYGDHQPEADAREDSGKEADVGGSPVRGFPVRPASIALAAVVVAQLLWVALLVYGAYSAVVWLPL
jgi:hypothetical protein